jgi:peptide deformylase
MIAAEVPEITPEILALWDDMIDTMDAMPGVGLAAPQIGVGLRLAVVDASDKRDRRIRLANPEIIDASAGGPGRLAIHACYLVTGCRQRIQHRHRKLRRAHENNAHVSPYRPDSFRNRRINMSRLTLLR